MSAKLVAEHARRRLGMAVTLLVRRGRGGINDD
jgi:hypothetical protein